MDRHTSSVSMDIIIKSIIHNQTKKDNIDPIIIIPISDNDDSTPTLVKGPGGVSIIPLTPPGPVSLYLWHTNAEYRAGNFNVRKDILRSTLTTLHERFQQELKGRSANRTKSIEQLEQQDTSAVSPPMNTPDLNRALCNVLNIQIIEVDDIHKHIVSYPNDIRQFSKEYPIYLASQGCRSVYIMSKDEEARPFFKSWFNKLLNEEFKYEWPVSDGTLKDLKDKLQSYMLTINVDKPKKEDYAKLIGKAEAIKHINSEFV
jgi:hypothetical protein